MKYQLFITIISIACFSFAMDPDLPLLSSPVDTLPAKKKSTFQDDEEITGFHTPIAKTLHVKTVTVPHGAAHPAQAIDRSSDLGRSSSFRQFSSFNASGRSSPFDEKIDVLKDDGPDIFKKIKVERDDEQRRLNELSNRIEEERKRKYAQEKESRLVIDVTSSIPLFPKIEELRDLGVTDIQGIQKIITDNEKWEKTGGLTVGSFFNPDDSINQIKFNMEELNKVLVIRDPRNSGLLALLIYQETRSSEPCISIQLCLEGYKKRDPRIYSLFQEKLTELCKRKNCKKISVVPSSNFENDFYHQQGYHLDASSGSLVYVMS